MKTEYNEMSKLYNCNKEQIIKSHNEVKLEFENKLKEA